jgi:hypothetical protein
MYGMLMKLQQQRRVAIAYEIQRIEGMAAALEAEAREDCKIDDDHDH